MSSRADNHFRTLFTGAQVTLAPVTRAQVTGAEVTGAQVTGACWQQIL